MKPFAISGTVKSDIKDYDKIYGSPILPAVYIVLSAEHSIYVTIYNVFLG